MSKPRFRVYVQPCAANPHALAEVRVCCVRRDKPESLSPGIHSYGGARLSVDHLQELALLEEWLNEMMKEEANEGL